MPIREESSRPQVSKATVEFKSEEDMASTIRTILENLPDGIEGFYLASQMYGSDFFEGESDKFKRALSKALKTKFANFSNAYWDKLAALR